MVGSMITKRVYFRSFATVRLVAINDVYELENLPKLNTFLGSLFKREPSPSTPLPSAVIIAGDFISPSTLSSIDSGRGMVASLRAAGITHAIFGNHEADVQLSVLADRVRELSKSCVVLNSNMRRIYDGGFVTSSTPENSWIVDLCPPYSIVSSQCGNIQVALLGLLSDEKGIFKDNTFKGIPISDVCVTVGTLSNELKELALVIPVTHQSIDRDRELAASMATLSGGLIIGGHDHSVMHETVNGVTIVKSGEDAVQCAVIDLHFHDTSKKLDFIKVTFEELANYDDCDAVLQVVEKHKSVIKRLEQEIILDARTMFAEVVEDLGSPVLSSLRTRHTQTTIGGLLCQALKLELDADVAIINGASIKGNTSYPSGQLTYAELKKELPFPTKMVVVPMPAKVLREAIEYSRTSNEGKDDSVGDVPRKGYLQTDTDFWKSCTILDDELVLEVAMPRNLLRGFCHIKPLVEYNKELEKRKLLPSGDDYIPVLNLVTRFCCKERWAVINSGGTTFEDFDHNKDGVIDRSEVLETMRRVLGYDVEEFVIDGMMEAIDSNGNGIIDHGEFDQLLAQVKRRHQKK